MTERQRSRSVKSIEPIDEHATTRLEPARSSTQSSLLGATTTSHLCLSPSHDDTLHHSQTYLLVAGSYKPFTATGTAVVNSTTFTLTEDNSKIRVGYTIRGTGIPDGTTVTAIDEEDAKILTLSKATTEATTAATVDFRRPPRPTQPLQGRKYSVVTGSTAIQRTDAKSDTTNPIWRSVVGQENFGR